MKSFRFLKKSSIQGCLIVVLLFGCKSQKVLTSSVLEIQEVKERLIESNSKLCSDFNAFESQAKGFRYLLNGEEQLALPYLLKAKDFYHLTYAYSELRMDSAAYYFDQYCKTKNSLLPAADIKKLKEEFDFIPSFDSIVDANIIDGALSKTETRINLEYRDLITKLQAKDQEVRLTKPIDYSKMREVDAENKRALDSLVAIYGWPGTKVIGKNMLNDQHVVPSTLVIHQDLATNINYLNASLESYQNGMDDYHNFSTIVTNSFYRFKNSNKSYNYLPLMVYEDSEVDLDNSKFLLLVLAKYLTNNIRPSRSFELLLAPPLSVKSKVALEDFFEAQGVNKFDIRLISEEIETADIPEELRINTIYMALRKVQKD